MKLESKKAIRDQMALQRDTLSQDVRQRYANWINEQLWKIVEEGGHKIIHSYYPFRSEIDITSFLEKCLQSSITIVCPKTLKDGNLEHLQLTQISDISIGKYNTPFPATQKKYEGKYDMIIVPGLAFSTSGIRLGYGGGYYDRFLAAHSEAIKIAPAYPFQIIENLPFETHDEQVDLVLSSTDLKAT